MLRWRGRGSLSWGLIQGEPLIHHQKKNCFHYSIMFTAWQQLAYRQTKCTVMTKNNKDMAILPANKGLVTVGMDRTDYHNKMNALVNNKKPMQNLRVTWLLHFNPNSTVTYWHSRRWGYWHSLLLLTKIVKLCWHNTKDLFMTVTLTTDQKWSITMVTLLESYNQKPHGKNGKSFYTNQTLNIWQTTTILSSVTTIHNSPF